MTVLLSKTEQGLSWDETPLVSLKALDLDPLVAENRKYLSKINYMIKRNGLNEFPLHISKFFINGRRLYIDMAGIHITVSILFANGQLNVCRRKRYILLCYIKYIYVKVHFHGNAPMMIRLQLQASQTLKNEYLFLMSHALKIC